MRRTPKGRTGETTRRTVEGGEVWWWEGRTRPVGRATLMQTRIWRPQQICLAPADRPRRRRHGPRGTPAWRRARSRYRPALDAPRTRSIRPVRPGRMNAKRPTIGHVAGGRSSGYSGPSEAPDVEAHDGAPALGVLRAHRRSQFSYFTRLATNLTLRRRHPYTRLTTQGSAIIASHHEAEFLATIPAGFVGTIIRHLKTLLFGRQPGYAGTVILRDR